MTYQNRGLSGPAGLLALTERPPGTSTPSPWEDALVDTAQPRFLRPLKAPAENLGQVLKLGPERPLVLDCQREVTAIRVGRTIGAP